jgi:hypothetical protein
VAAVSFVVWLKPQADLSKAIAERTKELVPDGDWLNFIAKVGGLFGGALGSTFTLFAGWHFLEMNLPRRIEELKQYHTSDHLALRPQLLAIARGRLRFIPADIETSRITLLRTLVGGWTRRDQTRLLAATWKRLGDEAKALSSATAEAQHQQITSHLIRGLQCAFRGNDDDASAQFYAAAKIRNDDITSRDIAAGWARYMKDHARERQLLREIRDIDIGPQCFIDHARSFRREAELAAKGNNEPARAEALARLGDARNLLQNVVPGTEASLELGRVLTLFCEVRCDRGTPGNLSSANQPLGRMRQYMNGIATHCRPDEGPSGEHYGEERASAVERRVADLLAEGQRDSGEVST